MNRIHQMWKGCDRMAECDKKSFSSFEIKEIPVLPSYIEQLRKDMPWCEIGF